MRKTQRAAFFTAKAALWRSSMSPHGFEISQGEIMKVSKDLQINVFL